MLQNYLNFSVIINTLLISPLFLSSNLSLSFLFYRRHTIMSTNRHIVTPSHHYLCSSSPSHSYLTSAQAHRHAVTSRMLQLSITSPLLQLAFISVNGEEEDPWCYRGGRRTRGDRTNKRMRERMPKKKRRTEAPGDTTTETGHRSWRKSKRLFTDDILDY